MRRSTRPGSRDGWSRWSSGSTSGRPNVCVCGVVPLDIGPGDQYVVRRASERDGPLPQRPDGPQDLLLIKGRVAPPGDHVHYEVQRPLLLASADITYQGRGGYLAETYPGDGGRSGRLRLAALEVSDTTRRPSEAGHEGLMSGE